MTIVMERTNGFEPSTSGMNMTEKREEEEEEEEEEEDFY